MDRYATLSQLVQTAPFHSNRDALELVLRCDGAITAAAERYAVDKEMIQAVLFQEIRFWNLFDYVDLFVNATYEYLQQKEDYEALNWQERLTVPRPSPPLVLRLDSSTGLGQIFADTAIRALNWEAGEPLYDREDWHDLRDVWVRLRTDDRYNIQMTALVLAYKRSVLMERGVRDPSPADIMQAYNGTGPLSVRYREVTADYYQAFRAYNLGQTSLFKKFANHSQQTVRSFRPNYSGVNHMEWTCSDIYMLLQREPAAREYYNALPRYIKDRLDYSPDGVTTLPRLVQRAQEAAQADLTGHAPFGVSLPGRS